MVKTISLSDGSTAHRAGKRARVRELAPIGGIELVERGRAWAGVGQAEPNGPKG
jgi:hypothetical protein